MTSREDNVFSRLTSSTAQIEPNVVSGNITPYTGKVCTYFRIVMFWDVIIFSLQSLLKGSLQCVAVAEGHSSGVLSICTTDELMFTGAAGMRIKKKLKTKLIIIHYFRSYRKSMGSFDKNRNTNITWPSK